MKSAFCDSGRSNASISPMSAEELAKEFAEELLDAGAEAVFPISGATGQGVEALLDAVVGYLPAATATERPAGEREESDDTPWSPL